MMTKQRVSIQSYKQFTILKFETVDLWKILAPRELFLQGISVLDDGILSSQIFKTIVQLFELTRATWLHQV